MQWHSLLVLSFLSLVYTQQDTSCSAVRPCLQGCCSQYGQCGFGDEFCGDGCQGTCFAKPECGDGADTPLCPLGVCCSKYGFCGTTQDFCTGGCQSGCDTVSRPSCDANSDALSLTRRIGYYEMFNLEERACDYFLPEHVTAGALTHLNLAFALIGDDFKITQNNADIVARAAHLKERFPDLRVTIAIGGWAFNDPPTQQRWSQMVGDYSNKQTFIASLVDYLTKFGLDGVDLDWEYPVADDRGGDPDDMANYVVFVAQLREAFDRVNPGWEITLTLPSSYWYLRGFDLQGLQKYVSWFNVMTYDLHGMWDQHNRFTGPYLKGHTNITEIDQGLDLLWRNNVLPENVVMGFGFYGRSFTMDDPSCHDPSQACTFSAAGLPGDCSTTAGILTYAEIQSRNDSLNSVTYYDPESTVKYTTYLNNQWVSYDDEQSFSDKKEFLTKRCISGLMIWAVDQDSQQYDALSALLGNEVVQDSLTRGSQLSDAEKEKLSHEFAGYNGQNCFVTELCTDGSDGEKGAKQVCPAGTSSVSTAHSPLQRGDHAITGQCSEGWYRNICCPSNEMPQNCKWNGEPIRSAVGCTGKCGTGQFELNRDTYIDPLGEGQCYQGQRSLCCDSTAILEQCFWTSCQGPLRPYDPPGENGTPGCPTGTKVTASRYDLDNGGWCSESLGSPLHDRFKRALCCPTNKGFNNCKWSSNQDVLQGKTVLYNPKHACVPRSCNSGSTKIAESLQPAPYNELMGPGGTTCDGTCTVGDQCSTFPIPPDYSPEFPLCCDPPSEYDERWPVPPHYLWADGEFYEDPDSDVAWNFADNFGSNNADTTDNDVYEEPGKDPYGFLMLDGPPQSIDNNFGDSFTVARRSAAMPKKRRSMVTTNQTIIDSTFDHVEERVFVYCNHPQGSSECEKPFYKGAADTIIKLPDHVGEGPYARIVSMELAPRSYKLAAHHLKSRALEGNTNDVYELTFDYNFHLIKRADGPVNMRIDYTNLLPYWDEMTNSPASKSKKRSVYDSISQQEWKSVVKSAKQKHEALTKRNTVFQNSTTDMMGGDMHSLSKRWFGTFLNWLRKMTTVESKDVGFLTMAFQKSFLLYQASIGCIGRGFFAEMQMFLDADVQMDATYAYYLSGTIAPPHVTDTYGYLAVEPSAYLGLRIQGNAIVVYTSEWKKIIDTLTYPGLSIKGIATVGPSLDIFGRIRGQVTLSGQVKAGARVNFGKAELYFPQGVDGTEGADDFDKITGLDVDRSKPTDGLQLEPQFYASAQASAGIFIDVSPNVKMGINVGPSVLGANLVDAQIIAFVNGTLSFEASVRGSVGTGTDASYSYMYGSYLYYNLGYGGYANIFGGTWNWQYRPVYLYPGNGMQYTIYENNNVPSDDTPNSKRGLEAPPIKIPRRGLLNGDSDAGLRPYLLHTSQENSILGSHSHDWSPHNASIPNGPNLFLGKRADPPSAVNDGTNSAQFVGSQTFSCPPRGTREVVLPDFRYNCRIFSSIQVDGQTRVVPGICDGITNFFQRRALSSNGLTLTWDPNRRDERDAYTCGSVSFLGASFSYCTAQDRALKSDLGLPAGGQQLISCDEFPFGGAEEGGSFYARVSSQVTPPNALCVPDWQQRLQGQCNTMLNNLYTNVAYFDRADGGTDENWKKWSTSTNDNRWTPGGLREGAARPTDAPAFQRLARYPDIIPLAEGVNVDDWNAAGQKLGYNFKRNFTFGLAYTSEVGTDTEWGSQAYTAHVRNRDGVRVVQSTEVFCAINTHGQPDVYRYGVSSGPNPYNGICYSGTPPTSAAGFGTRPSFGRCRIDFQGSTFDSQQPPVTSSKRSIGKFHTWDITSIELDPDENSWTDIPEGQYSPENMMPATFASPDM